MTSKQALMAADNGSIFTSTKNYTKPIPSFFPSPRLFTALSSKGFSEPELLKSPTSILDSKPFSSLANTSTTSSTTTSTNKHPWESKLDYKGLGIAIVANVLNDENEDKNQSKPDSPMVLFGSQLKIQIPPISSFPPSPTESPKSPTDFGIKTRRNSQLDSSSVSPSLIKSPFGSANLGVDTSSPRVFTGCLSASDMESSEEYTCVITHGPNPKTTHIFDDCIVENCCGVIGLSGSNNKEQLDYPSGNFLSFCYTCKKNLGQGNDIYIYRGEKAFCSCECRYQEILREEGMEKSELDGSLKTYYLWID